MTQRNEVLEKPNYRPYLDHGFIGLINHMGSDESIEFATRMSYGQGTRQVSDTRNLIRYLVRHYHTSPIEMGEVVFHIKVPIAIMRQLVRHRTASLNEYSARYSELTDEVYVPPPDRIQFQSTDNKQGSGAEFDLEKADNILGLMQASYADTDGVYRELLNEGLSRETARMVMPVGGYTEVVWKSDLKNFFHMIKLRADSHAQAEIQDLANIKYDLVKPLFPITCEAFEDYWMNGTTISVFEIQALRQLLDNGRFTADDLEAAISMQSAIMGRPPLSKREIKEFINRFN